jgi:hypothetical protein
MKDIPFKKGYRRIRVIYNNGDKSIYGFIKTYYFHAFGGENNKQLILEEESGLIKFWNIPNNSAATKTEIIFID